MLEEIVPRPLSTILFLASLLVLSCPSGCKRPPASPPSITPTVTTAKPIEKEIVDHADFTGRTDAVFSTDIRPRVTGYLVGMPFKEGGRVTKDQVLFEIDERPYKAALDLAKGSDDAARAAVIKTQADYDMDVRLKKVNAGAISDEELIKRLGARDEARGNAERAKAAVVSAQLNYDWCKVRAPVAGQAGRYLLTLGNLVNADATQLTTVVSEDPIYVYFDVDENTMLEVVRTVILPAKVDPLTEKNGVPVLMELADEKGFPHSGHVNFGNNVVNASTGTITVRGAFDNPATSAGKRLLRPGMFVRVRLPLGKPHAAVLVNEKALGSDQGQKYLLVVNDKDVVEYRRVKTGPLQENGLRVIQEGVQAGERVIINGLQLVRPEMTVKVEEAPMPMLPTKEPPAEPKHPVSEKK
jgi:membrane fusion protein, multidrug efflux system